MLTRLLILGSLIFLTACGEPKVETRLIVPEISSDLRTPVPISDRRANTLRDLSILATEHLTSAQSANAKIESIDAILSCAEARADGQQCQNQPPG